MSAVPNPQINSGLGMMDGKISYLYRRIIEGKIDYELL